MLREFLHKHAAYNSGSPVFYKDFGFKPADIKVEGRTVDCYVAMFGNKDRAGDVLVKGCFAKSIQERGPASANPEIAYLWQHEMDEPLGRPLVLEERDLGLFASNYHDEGPGMDQSDRALTQQKSGTLKFYSIGFNYVWDKVEYDSENDQFIVKELELFEESVVTIACNNQTGIVAVKSQALIQEREQLMRETEAALKKLNPRKQYELRQLIAKHLSLADTQPLEFLKEALKEVDKPITKAIDWSKLADKFLVSNP